jgi:hypothetical protein
MLSLVCVRSSFTALAITGRNAAPSRLGVSQFAAQRRQLPMLRSTVFRAPVEDPQMPLSLGPLAK